MNIFLIHPDASTSGQMLFARDPLRARKQIVECAQLLAFFEIRHTGSTTLLAASGIPYRATKSQLNHPIATHMQHHRAAYDLCWDVLQGLLEQCPDHACGRSMKDYSSKRLLASYTVEEYIVCRRLHQITYAKSRRDYADVLLKYLKDYKWRDA